MNINFFAKEMILSEKERRWKTNEANKWNNVTIF
jgi:hypothetical protein